MATVGINFGTATSGSGFDVATTVASIVANLKAVEAPWTKQLTSLKAQDTAFTSIGTDLATLSSSLLALTDFQGVMASKLGSSSDTNILSLGAAGPTAVAGSHTIVVSQLAQTSSRYTDPVLPTDILRGALTFQVGSGPATTIPVVSGISDTLSTYAAAINLADIGVSARIISDTSGSRLSIVSNTSGAAGQLTITSGGTTGTSTAPTTAAASVAPTASIPASNTFTLPTAASKLSGTFNYSVGSGVSGSVDLGSNPLSLTDTASALNADGGFAAARLTATVDGAKLVVTGYTDATGAATIVTAGSSMTTTTPAATYGVLTDTTATTTGIAVKLNVGLDGQNAKLSVDGLGIESASNMVTGAIPGVSFQLISSDPSTVVQVQIANDNSTVQTAFTGFITAYNAVLQDIKTQEGKDSSGNAEPLFGNTVISEMQSALSLALTSGTASGAVSSLYQLGISINRDGTLKLDTDALNAELNSHYADVVGFLQNAGSFGQSLSSTLDNLGNSNPAGALFLALAANNNQETVLNNNVTAEDVLIARKQTDLTNELNIANEVLQAIPRQLNEVNELYSAMTGYNSGTSG
jgi:flagellar hook-associated protein 2